VRPENREPEVDGKQRDNLRNGCGPASPSHFEHQFGVSAKAPYINSKPVPVDGAGQHRM